MLIVCVGGVDVFWLEVWRVVDVVGATDWDDEGVVAERVADGVTDCEGTGLAVGCGVAECVGEGDDAVGEVGVEVDVGVLPPVVPTGLTPPTDAGRKCSVCIVVINVAVYLPAKLVNPSQVGLTCWAYQSNGAGLSTPPHVAVTALDGTFEKEKPTMLPL